MTKQSPLGKNINFPKAFSKDLLHPISRAEQRDNMLSASLNGYDMWNIFDCGSLKFLVTFIGT